MLRKSLLLAIIFLIPIQGVCAGEIREDEIVIIYLKNKGQLEGYITEQTEEGFVLDVGYGTVAVSGKDVDRIETPAGVSRNGLIKTWRGHTRATQKTKKERKRAEEQVRRRIEESLKVKREIAERERKEKEHRISFADKSKITVEVLLNGEVKTRMVVDTGANTVLVPMAIVEELPEMGALSEEKVTTKLADGTEREGTPIVLKSVEVAGLKAENVDAITMDLKGQDGLLGMSFLKRFHVRIDAENSELILKEK